MSALLVAEGLTRSFPVRGTEVVALAEVSLDVRPGETLAITGPSGSGKSTLLAVLSGWDRPTRGSVSASARTAFLPQRVAHVEELTVRDNLRLARPGGVPDDEAEDVARSLSVEALLDRYPAEASIGERQRVGIARTLLSRADVLLLDEPTAHQDAHHAGLVLAALAPTPGSAVVVSTHDEGVAARASRRVVLSPARST